jgi:YegS/Rv2252/BmrU family lipid kinase
MNTIWIVNPASGRRRGSEVLARLPRLLADRGLGGEIVATTRPGEATQLARRAADDGVRVVAVGGDGTAHEVVNGIAGTRAVLGLVPIGSGNDLARALEIPSAVERALDVIARGRTARIDLGRFDHRWFANSVGLGFEAQVTIESRSITRLRGFAIYLGALAKALRRLRCPDLRVITDQGELSGRALLVCIGNGFRVGGGFRLTPDARATRRRASRRMLRRGDGEARRSAHAPPLSRRDACRPSRDHDGKDPPCRDRIVRGISVSRRRRSRGRALPPLGDRDRTRCIGGASMIDLPRLIDDHARFPSVVLGLIQGAEEAFLREHEAEGRWSPLEILAHLRDEEIEDFRPRAQACIAGRPLDKPIAPATWVVSRRYNEMDPGAVFLDFAKERADSCRWLATLAPADLDKSVTHSSFGTMRAGDFIAAWRVHDLLHARQLSTALAVLTARRFAEWKVDYAGTIPGSISAGS